MVMPMLQQVARFAYPYGSVRRVLRGPARGMRFVVAPGIGLTYAWGTAAAAPRHFGEWIRPGATVYDVGANKGQMALLFAALVGPRGRVVAFEPAPGECDILRRNLALNGLAQVRAVQAAAAESAGELTFSYAPDRPTQGKLRDVEMTYANPGARDFPVPAVALDDVGADERAPDVIKIDVEGAAGAVLRGARGILDRARPRIYVELHGPEEQAGLRDELQSRGYTLRTLAGQVVSDPVARWHSPLWCHP
jgi:FkbM family methyltransferase